MVFVAFVFFFQAEDGIRDHCVTGVQTCALPICELLRAHCAAIATEEAVLREGGGRAGHERQRKMNRLPVRERLGRLLDKESPFFEIGLWAAYKMYRSEERRVGKECRSRWCAYK